MPWKILKPMALGSVMVLLLWIHYGDVIKSLVSPLSLKQPNQKATTPQVQKESTQEKKSQAPQPLSATQNPSSPDATSQLGGEMSAANGTTTSQDKPLEAGPQNSAEDFPKLNTPLPVFPEAEKVSPEGLPPAPPLIATHPQGAYPASVLEEPVEQKAEAKSVSGSSGLQPGEKGLKEKEVSTLVNAERISEGSEKNQQSPSAPAATQDSTVAEKTDTETPAALINPLDAQLSEQQTGISPKVTVQPGDNLTKIALQHYPNKEERSGIEAILKSNPQIENRDLIYPGQVLVLPEKETNSNPVQESGEKTENKFAVQICTLFNASSAFAEAYVAELKQKGYSAYSAEAKTKDDKIIYKIFIGNYGTPEEAETAARDFQKNEGKPDIIIKPELAQPLESKEEEK
jgi:LysM domain./Sporulation related domain.